MDAIGITDLSSHVIGAMSSRGLKEKSIKEFERYGLRRIISHFSDLRRTIYSKDLVWAFVQQERLRMEQGQLPEYQWGHIRRAAVYLAQMAEYGAIQKEPLPKWETEQNRLFCAVPPDEPPSQNMEVLICQVRDRIMKLDLSKKAQTNYLYCGLGAILKYCDLQGVTAYSKELLYTFMEETKEKYLSGKIKRAVWQNIRKAVLWTVEFQETGELTHRRLTNTKFQYASSDFEQLIKEYALHLHRAGYLKEGTQSIYITAVRAFFRRMETLGRTEYGYLTLRDVTDCIRITAEEMPLGIFNTMVAMRSFAQFISEVHPELPDISAALICAPAKRRRVYEGYSEQDAQKILKSIDRESVLGKRDFAMIMLAHSTGLRGCDIVNLQFENIDWRSCEIRLVQEKTNIPLALPLDAATANAIAEYILNGRPKCESKYIFVRSQRPYTKLSSLWTTIAKYARKALESCGKPNGPHAFRRGMGKRLLEAGIPSSLICDVLGHTSAAVLRQYTASSLKYLKQCAGTLEAIPVTQEALR